MGPSSLRGMAGECSLPSAVWEGDASSAVGVTDDGSGEPEIWRWVGGQRLGTEREYNAPPAVKIRQTSGRSAATTSKSVVKSRTVG